MLRKVVPPILPPGPSPLAVETPRLPSQPLVTDQLSLSILSSKVAVAPRAL